MVENKIEWANCPDEMEQIIDSNSGTGWELHSINVNQAGGSCCIAFKREVKEKEIVPQASCGRLEHFKEKYKTLLGPEDKKVDNCVDQKSSKINAISCHLVKSYDLNAGSDYEMEECNVGLGDYLKVTDLVLLLNKPNGLAHVAEYIRAREKNCPS